MEHDFAKRGASVRSFLFKKVLSFDPDEDVALYILLDQPQKLGGLDFTPYFSHCPINDLTLGTIVRALAKEEPHGMLHYASVYLARKHGSSQAVEIMASTSFRQLLRGISTGKINREAMLRLQRLSNSPSWTNHQTGLLTLSQLSRLHAALQTAISKKR